jgi:UDP-N-acetylmuramyl pentapeptide phosphotransferase/UDP-N-acetylglucosamine-1-phosphate transferase
MSLIMPKLLLGLVKVMKMGLVNFIPVVIFIITAVSNGANLTDGIDGCGRNFSISVWH